MGWHPNCSHRNYIGGLFGERDVVEFRIGRLGALTQPFKWLSM